MAKEVSVEIALEKFESAMSSGNFKSAYRLAKDNGLEPEMVLKAAEENYKLITETGDYRVAFEFGEENGLAPDKISDSATLVFQDMLVMSKFVESKRIFEKYTIDTKRFAKIYMEAFHHMII